MFEREAAVLGAMALLASACNARGGPDASAFRVVALEGTASVRDAETGERSIVEGARLGPGASIRIDPRSLLTLARGDSQIEVRPSGGDGEAMLDIESLEVVRLGGGDTLVTVDPAAPVSVQAQGQQIGATAERGVFRFDRRLSLRIGAYRGDATVRLDGGATLHLPAYDEWIVAARVAPVQQPLHIDPNDPWDQRLLGDVLALDRQLEAQARGYEGRFGATVRSVAELRAFAGPAMRALVAPYLSRLGSADVLIALEIAQLARSRSPGGVMRSIVQRRALGASWGLIAAAYGIRADDVLSAVVCAIGLRTGETPAGTNCVTGEGPSPSPTRTTGPTTRPSRGPSPSPSPSGSRSPSPSPSPSVSVSPTPTPSCSMIDHLLGNC